MNGKVGSEFGIGSDLFQAKKRGRVKAEINRSAPWPPENRFAIFFRRKKYRNNNQDLSIVLKKI